MKIFVGWPYDADWVETYAIPLIESYGVEVLTGKELQGQVITAGVRDLLADADGAVFFTTRRGQEADGTWATSDWVVDEIKHAQAIGVHRVLEVREAGVEYPNKIQEPRQYIPMDPEARLRAFVELGQTVSRWRGLSFKLKLLPEDFVQAVRARIGAKNYTCAYTVRRQGQIVYGPKPVELVREGFGVFGYAHDLPTHLLAQGDTFIELTVEAGDQWSSPGIQLSTLEVTLEKL
jgi:hypothetical protein